MPMAALTMVALSALVRRSCTNDWSILRASIGTLFR